MERVKKYRNVCSVLLLVCLIFYLHLGTTAIVMNAMTYFNFSIYLSYFGLGSFLLYIGYKVLERENIRWKDIFILLLAGLALTSYLHAWSEKDAFYGTATRNEGILVLFTYYSIYLLSTTIENKVKSKLMNIVLFFGVLQIVIGTIQTLRISNILGYDRSTNWSTHFKFASGTFGNPNFYSTYILMCFLYTLGFVCTCKKKAHRLLYFFLLLCFGYGLIIGDTSGCILSAFLVLLVVLLKKVNRGNIKKIGITFAIFLLLVIGVLSFFDSFVNHRIRYTMNKNIQEIKEIFDEGITDSTGNYRVYLWKEIIKRVPKYYLTGIGIDNFSYLNEGKYICRPVEPVRCFDKAHNEYLQILITEGVFAFIVYLLFIGFVIYYGKENVQSGILYAVIGYLLQALFNISVIPVAPIFYMLMGFMHPKDISKECDSCIIKITKERCIVKKNVMLFIGYLTNGGAERSITNVANELSKTHNVILVVAGAKKIDYPCHVPIVEVPELRMKNKLKGMMKVRKLKKKYHIDVTISYTTIYNFCNVVSKYKDKTIISIRNHLSTKKEKKRDVLFHKISLCLADRIVCCSRSVEYDQLHHFKANPEKMFVIQNFCNLEGIIKDMGEEIKEEDKKLLSEHLVVTMARLVPHKGHKHIIKAMQLVVKQIPDCHLLIFSRGPLREELEVMVKDLHLENNIFFMDFHSNPYQFIQKAKAFILASDYEGFPNVLIEAMACGAPIVATDAPGGSKEIVSNTVSFDSYTKQMQLEEYGILIPSFMGEHDRKDITENEKILADTLLQLLTNKTLYEKYHENSLTRVNAFHRDKMIKKWLDIIEE